MAFSLNDKTINVLPGDHGKADYLIAGNDYLSLKLKKVLRTLVIISGTITVASGLLVLAGWLFGIEFLKTANSHVISIKANTAICFILTGSALFLEEYSQGNKKIILVTTILSLLVMIISLLTLGEYYYKWEPGIDELFFKDLSPGNAMIFPGRMATITCWCFLTVSISMILFNTKIRALVFISRVLPLITIQLGLIPLLGYAYGVDKLFGLGLATDMAPYTAILMVVASFGVLCLWNYTSFLTTIRFNGPGGYMARNLLPVAAFVPVVFIWIHILVAKDPQSGFENIVIISLLYIAVFAFTIWKIARAVNSLEDHRQNAESGLSQLEKRFYIAFHSSPAALLISTMNSGKIIDANDAYSRLVGKPLNELLGNSVLKMNLWADLGEREKMIANIREQGSLSNYEIKLRHETDEVRTTLTSVEQIKLDGEDCIITSAIDITDWKKAQESLMLSEKQNMMANEILEHLNNTSDSFSMIGAVIKSIRKFTGFEAVGIRLKEGDDYPYFQTSGFSPEFVKAERYLCSYSSSGKIARDENNEPILECMCGNILCGRIDSSKSFFTKGGSFRSNNTTYLLANTTEDDRMARTRNRCNSSGYESVALIPLRSCDEIIGLLQLNDHRKDVFNESIIPFFERIGSSIGIALMRNKVEHELKRFNAELETRVQERTDQLTDSNKELEAFAYSVSHDLRAPLRHMAGFTDILESELGDRMDPEIGKITGVIKSSARRMSQLIDELLSYSRTGRTDPKYQQVNPNTIIDEVLKQADNTIKDRNIEWKISKLPEVKADPVLIKLVFQNLIDNAIKFTSKKESAEIEIAYKDDGKNETIIYVRDNGAGFSMKYYDKLFGVFQRLHTESEFNGTGIGLATVRRIIRKHGGRVWAEAEEGAGATIYFSLPK